MTCHVRDADDPAAEGASLQVKLSLRTPFPCQVVLDVTETGLLEKSSFSRIYLASFPTRPFSRPSWRSEVFCLGFCYKGGVETAALSDEPVSRRYWLSTANVSTSTECRSRGSGAALAGLGSCCTDGWSLPSTCDAVTANQTQCMCSNFCGQTQQLGDPPRATGAN